MPHRFVQSRRLGYPIRHIDRGDTSRGILPGRSIGHRVRVVFFRKNRLGTVNTTKRDIACRWRTVHSGRLIGHDGHRQQPNIRPSRHVFVYQFHLRPIRHRLLRKQRVPRERRSGSVHQVRQQRNRRAVDGFRGSDSGVVGRFEDIGFPVQKWRKLKNYN